jgi:hypothetical protein
MAEHHFGMTRFFGMYRDDGNVVFEGSRTAEELEQWLFNFQAKVNEDVGSTDIQFTMDIWKPGEASRTIVPKKVKVVGTDSFPYLDMEMKYDDDDHLCFGVYTKPGFQSKYLNTGSTHPPAVFRAVPHGVSIRLAGLTTRTAQNENESLSDIYPDVHSALQKSGYFTGEKKLPSLGQVLDNREREQMASQLRKEERKKDKRNVYVLSRWSGNWRTKPIHKTIKKLADRRGLKWLRARMVHKRHQNLKEMLLGDIQRKVSRGVVSAEYEKKTRKKKCNCRSSHKVDGQCIYGEECETCSVVYKVTCLCCGDYYLGKTQNSMKLRCQKHYQDVGKFFDKRKAAERWLDQPLSANSAAQTPVSNQRGSSNRRSTRSSTRSASSQQTPSTNPFASSGMDYLISLFSQFSGNLNNTQTSTTPNGQPTIYEDQALTANASDLSDAQSSTQPRNLSTNPQFQLSDQESTTQSEASFEMPREKPPSPTVESYDAPEVAYLSDDDSHSHNNTSPDEFARAFPGRPAVDEFSELHRVRSNILTPMLTEAYQGIECSTLSRHMWSHCKNMSFDDKNEMYTWIRSNWHVEIVYRGSVITNMKSAGTKNCNLCMQERIKLFYAFHKKKTPNNNLMNSRTEMYGKCTCKTRFLRLVAVGNGGADEATG